MYDPEKKKKKKLYGNVNQDPPLNFQVFISKVKTAKLDNSSPNKNKFDHNRKWASSPQKCTD